MYPIECVDKKIQNALLKIQSLCIAEKFDEAAIELLAAEKIAISKKHKTDLQLFRRDIIEESAWKHKGTAAQWIAQFRL